MKISLKIRKFISGQVEKTDRKLSVGTHNLHHQRREETRELRRHISRKTCWKIKGATMISPPPSCLRVRIPTSTEHVLLQIRTEATTCSHSCKAHSARSCYSASSCYSVSSHEHLSSPFSKEAFVVTVFAEGGGMTRPAHRLRRVLGESLFWWLAICQWRVPSGKGGPFLHASQDGLPRFATW